MKKVFAAMLMGLALTACNNKQLYIVPGATHCDLYDGGEKSYIPFDKLEEFYKANLK